MSAQFSGYYTIIGTPSFTDEDCTLPNGQVGPRFKAGIDVAIGNSCVAECA